jgi:hypothetical protein
MGFTHQLDRHVERRPLKTKRSRRTLEVTPRLISTLRALKLVTPYSGSHDLVFTTRTGSGHDHRNIGGRVLRRAVTRAGLEPVERDGIVIQPGPTFHSLRHSHASRLIAAGWDIEEVSARLGHSNVATTQREYVHEFDAARRSDERRNRLAALYGAPVERPWKRQRAAGSNRLQPPTGRKCCPYRKGRQPLVADSRPGTSHTREVVVRTQPRPPPARRAPAKAQPYASPPNRRNLG